jgi:DNA-binding transcriptional MocR family regulator
VAGLHVCARAATDLDQVVRRAAAYGVTVRTLARFCHDTPQPGLVIGYGAIQSQDVPVGLERLRASF